MAKIGKKVTIFGTFGTRSGRVYKTGHSIVLGYGRSAGDSTIRADSAESKSLSDQYASRAKILKGCYWEHIGKKPGSGKSAVYGSVDWDLYGPYGDRLTNSNYLSRELRK